MSADQGNPVGAGGQMSSGSPRNAASRRRCFRQRTRPEQARKAAFLRKWLVIWWVFDYLAV